MYFLCSGVCSLHWKALPSVETSKCVCNSGPVKVIDGETKAALDNVAVQLKDATGAVAYQTMTAGDGTFARKVRPGRDYTLHFSSAHLSHTSHGVVDNPAKLCQTSF